MRVVMVTAHSSIDTALEAIRAGAVDYLVKPCSPEQLRVAAHKQIQARRLEQRVAMLEKEDGITAATEMESESTAPLRAAIVGAGYIGAVHVEALRRLDRQFGRIEKARGYAARPYEIVFV